MENPVVTICCCSSLLGLSAMPITLQGARAAVAAPPLRKTPTKWDEFLFEQRVFNVFALVVPAVIMFRAALPSCSSGGVNQLLRVAVILVVAVSVDRLLRAGCRSIQLSHFLRMPIKGFVQILQIALGPLQAPSSSHCSWDSLPGSC